MTRVSPLLALLFLVPRAHAQHTAPAPLLAAGPAWTHEGGQPGAGGGENVAAAGDVDGDGFDDLLVGMPNYDGAQVDSGLALLFRGGPGGLEPTPAWRYERDEWKALLGGSVAGAGDVNGDGFDDVLVGAPLHDAHTRSKLGELGAGPVTAAPVLSAGAAFLFLGSSSGLASAPDWTVQGSEADGFLGAWVAGAGDVDGDGFDDVIVGVPGGLGEARVYRGSSAGLSSVPAWKVSGTQLLAFFGGAVSSAGDVDGDGFDDVLVAAWAMDVPVKDAGQVWLYRGGPAGLSTQPAWTYQGNEQFLDLGRGLAPAGDVDGDGFDDVLVAAPSPPPQQGNARFLFFRGNAAGLEPAPSWSWIGSTGAAVGAGDLDQDGLSDVIIGDPSSEQVSVFRGTPAGPEKTLSWLEVNHTSNIAFGASVACAGDVDGDGLGDLAFSAPGYRGTWSGEGRALLYRGTVEPLLADEPDWTGFGTSGTLTGGDIAPAGDVDADGFDDVLVGANTNVLVIHGSAAGLESGPRRILVEPPQPPSPYSSLFPYVVDGGFDVNGDGYDDAAIGAPDASTLNPYSTFFGRAYVYLGSADGLAATPAWTGTGLQNGDRLGADLAGLGDVDGDGYDELGVILLGDAEAWIYRGSPSGLGSTPAWTLEAGIVTAAGDVNGDGLADVLVAAPANSRTFGIGQAELYFGSPTGIVRNQPDWALSGSQAFAVGDVDGDGFADLVANCSAYGTGWCVYSGSPAGPVPASATNLTYAAPWGVNWIDPAGDVNGDGFADMLAIGRTFSNPQVTEGIVTLFAGGPGGPSRVPGWHWESDLPNGLSTNQSRRPAASVGDVNGDGFSDLVIGTRVVAPGGAVFAFHGRP